VTSYAVFLRERSRKPNGAVEAACQAHCGTVHTEAAAPVVRRKNGLIFRAISCDCRGVKSSLKLSTPAQNGLVGHFLCSLTEDCV